MLDEAVLHRQVGGAATIRAVESVPGDCGASSVTLRVLPFDARAHAPMGTSFELLQFSEAGDSAIVYIEDHTSSQYPETASDLERYTLIFDRLRPRRWSQSDPRSSSARWPAA